MAKWQTPWGALWEQASEHVVNRGLSARNQLFFALRSQVHRPRLERLAPYEERAESLEYCFSDRLKPARWQALADDLLARYRLEDFRPTRFRWLETLTVLHHLETLLPDAPSAGGHVHWLDVGAKNWSYVQALDAFARVGLKAPSVSLDGVEVDAYRRYTDGHCRLSYARAFCRHLPDARYVVADIRDWPGRASGEGYDVVTCFLPFVFVEPHLAWGLPGNLFSPQAFLSRVLSLLKPGGVLIITNQGEDEASAQAALLAACDGADQLEVTEYGVLPESLLKYHYPRYGWVVRRACAG
ncbi:MAG: class I SAM-dependent methyltransferase [Candidatus Melainabacteria bacterium]